jgi:hypothetical protein
LEDVRAYQVHLIQDASLAATSQRHNTKAPPRLTDSWGD